MSSTKTIGRIFDLTIDVDHFESVEMSGQRQSFIFSNLAENLQPRWFFVRITKWRPVKIQSETLLQFTAPEAKNRPNLAGGWPPGMFIEALGYPSMVFPVKIQLYLTFSSKLHFS